MKRGSWCILNVKKEVAKQCDYYEPTNSLKEKGKFSQAWVLFVSGFNFIVLL